jgi:hypothetical protein
MTTLEEGIASIMRTRCYEPPALPRRVPVRTRVLRLISTIARQLTPTGWSLVFAAIAVGATLGFIL